MAKYVGHIDAPRPIFFSLLDTVAKVLLIVHPKAAAPPRNELNEDDQAGPALYSSKYLRLQRFQTGQLSISERLGLALERMSLERDCKRPTPDLKANKSACT